MLPTVTNTSLSGGMGDAESLTLGIIVTVCVLILLVLREFLQAAGKGSPRMRIQILNIALIPFLLAFGVLIILRVIGLVSAG